MISCDPPFKASWQPPINSGALKSFALIKYALVINVYNFENRLFSILVALQSDLSISGISSAGTYKSFLE